jgi:hypothetical protein
MDKKFYVYRYLRSSNSRYGVSGTAFYVGKGCGKRAWSRDHHVHPPSDESLIEFIAQDLSEKDALQIEMLQIHLLGRIDRGTGCLANRTDGGEKRFKGGSHSEEAKAKMAAAKLGKKRGPNPPEWNANIAAGNRGRKKAPEQIAKQSAALRGRPKPPRSEEYRQAIRNGKLGRKRPDMQSGSAMQLKSAQTRTGVKRGPYRRPE